jgi:hypothetical protein
MKDDGYQPLQPGDNDKGFHHGHAIEKPLARGSLDNGDRGTAMPHATMPNKVIASARVAAPQNEINAPAITSGATSKPSWPPGRGKMRP